MEKITWKYIQKSSDSILADGLWELTQKPIEAFSDISNDDFGNYLISHDSRPYYIGEAKNICKRLKQQFKPTTSTFFKNYQKYLVKSKDLNVLLIDNFNIQHMPTQLGRKEIEEFGIVNLPTLLNSFQLGKRNASNICCHNGLWSEVQDFKQKLIEEGEKDLFKQSFQKWFDIKIASVAGLYLVENKSGDLVYTGESSDISERYNTHSGKTYFSALRRHIATELLSFELKEINGKKKYLSDNEENAVSAFLKTCSASFYPIAFGRYELEEYLIRKHKPILNRKDNKD
jgi:predicted GIY-YIG superfamily endonuclease